MAHKTAPRKNILEPAAANLNHDMEKERQMPFSSPLLHIGIGGAIVGVCSLLRVLLAWWPLQPVAFVVLYSYAIQKIWLSLLIGWLAKVAVVRLGGATLLRRGRPVFIGLIVGEAFAAAVWLIVNLVLHWQGFEYKPLLFLPG